MKKRQIRFKPVKGLQKHSRNIDQDNRHKEIVKHTAWNITRIADLYDIENASLSGLQLRS